MTTIRVYTKEDEFKIGSIIPHTLIETEYDVITGERSSTYVHTWNWTCWGGGKKRRGKGKFKTLQDAKKAFLKVCPYHEKNLNFVEVA